MRIDIIVPNFDDSSDEVTLSSWYKKIGDKISKNDVIADAETARIACGITSSYDCILAKILVKEGENISQGTKIAVIETDLDAKIDDVIRELESNEEIKESSAISNQIKEDSDKKHRQEEWRRREEISELKEQKSPEEERGYSLSVPSDNVFAEENRWNDKSNEEVDNEADIELTDDKEATILTDTTSNIKMEEKITETLSNKLIDDISEYREEKIINIINTAEAKAREEAQALREKILEDAKKLAFIQSEELKIKILQDHEEKALKDASEMRQKIIQGSLSEAENTKAKIINEAKQKAEKEAEDIRKEIIKSAEHEAKEKAEKSIKDSITKAKENAKQEAEQISKEIIESAIRESKEEAKAIKKDIIHSANKHASKESEIIVREAIKDAKRSSNGYVRNLIEETTKLASKEAEELKMEILQFSTKEIMDAANQMLKNIKENIQTDIIDSVKDAKKEINYCKKFLKKEEIELEEENEIAKKLMQPLEKDLAPEMYADNWNKPTFFSSPEDRNVPIDFLKQRINEKMKSSLNSSVISTVSNEVDMSAILSLEKCFGKVFSKKHNTRLGFTPFFISASIAALKQYRIFNAHIRENEIIYKNNFDISIITCGNDGVTAPVIRSADSLSFAEIERSMIALSRRAIEGTLSIEEVSGGTFTIINAGIYGSLIGTDLLTPPQVATLSIHKMHNRPIATDSGVEIKPMLYISLSYDHRVADTKKASEFLSNVKSYVENPGWQILEL